MTTQNPERVPQNNGAQPINRDGFALLLFIAGFLRAEMACGRPATPETVHRAHVAFMRRSRTVRKGNLP